MSGLPSAVSLSRALISLSRGRGTGVLRVCSGADVCTMAVFDGVVRAAACRSDQLALGDVLLRSGDLNLQAHREALAQRPPQGPVGEWFVHEGIATRPAVEHALRKQLQARILEVFAWRGLDYTFIKGGADIGVAWVREPVTTSDLVLRALCAALQTQDVERGVASLGSATFELSSLGRALIENATLWPDEAAMVALLERGTDVERIAVTTRNSERARKTLAALASVAAVSVQGGSSARYQVLLRKQRQLRACASASELLDLPRGAVAKDARRALRRLASMLHPDALGPDATPALRATSTELMTALVRAELEVRSAL